LKNLRSNLIMVIFGEVYAVRLWFGWNWAGGAALLPHSRRNVPPPAQFQPNHNRTA